MRLFSLIMISFCLAGCAGSKRDADKINFAELQENLRFDNTDVKRQIFDMNRDGRVDLLKFYAAKQTYSDDAAAKYALIRKELDLNFDGRIDRIMYYDAKEALIREEIDADFDGKVDRISYYSDGLIVKTEIYSDQCLQIVIDGQDTPEVHPMTTRHYRKGIFTREEHDALCRGKLDSVFIYNEKGELSQTGLDRNGDGIIEEWIRY